MSGAAVGLVPSFSWQLVQRTFDLTYRGRLSGVNRMSARPRRMAEPMESSGMSASAGGLHTDSSNATDDEADDEIVEEAGAGARSSVHDAADAASRKVIAACISGETRMIGRMAG
jgi:hypothetical protein